jgi:Fe-S-cluster-containing dehydrogenase component
MDHESTRRTFLKQAGVTAAALSCTSLIGCGRRTNVVGEPDPRALDGERWAIVVDLKKCQEHEGCRDCVVACHREHNVPEEHEPKREIKWIWKEPFERAFPTQELRYADEKVKHKPALVFCNHCERPPCTRVCPTQATWKRDDGVVMMDMHRCIGCRYCMAACPYGSRSFNWQNPWEKEGEPIPAADLPNPKYPKRTRGVVEKCNFCGERIAVGKKPACVENCQHGALVFGDASDPNSPVRKLLKDRFFIRRKAHLGTEPHVFYLV